MSLHGFGMVHCINEPVRFDVRHIEKLPNENAQTKDNLQRTAVTSQLILWIIFFV
ncbi:hypothetical protein [Flavobacterium sp. ACN6]|uniref:hypothetical protein n=1 Tax=Flavobacterium sp. ACN6 TaxID=1920426 RepID=UPI001C0F2961|nr:hypothetical protein [Flavobacterium sp. ACN6]